jgi:hydroxymethylpyrimidine/phosphomethylpyrimidine kinase
MSKSPTVVLTIAGFDPSSGAGVTADIKTIAAHRCFGVACITALTVQSTAGVRRVEAVDEGIIRETLDELSADMAIAAVHLGMMGSAAAVRAVVEFLDKAKLSKVVLDPVLRSSSGADLLDGQGRELLVEKLIPLVAVMTPNVDEAEALTGLKVRSPEEMQGAAARLHEMGAAAVVITGGHLEQAIDLLSFSSARGIECKILKADKMRSNSTHGTGCAFSTSMACHLALGSGLEEAARLAKEFVAAAIAAGHSLGKGTGPVNHLYGMK